MAIQMQSGKFDIQFGRVQSGINSVLSGLAIFVSDTNSARASYFGHGSLRTSLITVRASSVAGQFSLPPSPPVTGTLMDRYLARFGTVPLRRDTRIVQASPHRRACTV